MALLHPQGLSSITMSNDNTAFVHVSDLVADLTREKDVLSPQIEGLTDYLSLNIKPETREAVEASKTALTRRLTLINSVLTTVDQLTGDGYPTSPAFNVTQTVYEDLAENIATMTAAIGKFTVREEATSATITAGPPAQK